MVSRAVVRSSFTFLSFAHLPRGKPPLQASTVRFTGTQRVRTIYSLRQGFPNPERRDGPTAANPCTVGIRQSVNARQCRSFAAASAVPAIARADAIRDDISPKPASLDSWQAAEGTDIAVDAAHLEAPLADVASDFGTRSITQIGDLAAMGLGGFTPAGLIEQMMEFIHVSTGLPFWSTIVVTTLAVRLALFPLMVAVRRNVVRFDNMRPEFERVAASLRRNLKEKREDGMHRDSQALTNLILKHKTNPLKAFLMPFAQAPVLISFFFALSHLSSLPIPDITQGGTAWFSDLSQPDPYKILPVMSVAMFMAIIKVGGETGAVVQTFEQKLTSKLLFWGAPLAIPLMLKFSSGMFVYFLTSQAFTMGQNFLLTNPKIQRVLGIPKRKLHINPAMVKIEEYLRQAQQNAKLTAKQVAETETTKNRQ